MFLRIVPFLIVLCAPLGAQVCPDLELDRIDQRVTIGPVVECSTLEYKWRGLLLGGGIGGCPTFVIIQPGYDSTRHRAGSNTYAVPSERVAVTRLTFTCDISYFLFIPLSTTCNPSNDRVIGHRTNYEFRPCALLPVDAFSIQQGE